MSSEQVERLTDKEKRYDSEDAVLIIDGVEYDVLALWGHVEALEQALEAQRNQTHRITERLQEIVNKHGWEVEAWGEDTLDIIEKKLEASQQEVERLQELMPDNGQVRCPGCGHDFLIAASCKRQEQVKTPDEDPTEIMDFPTSRVTPEYMQHASHCNQGEYEGVCKYGDSDCPILTEQEAQGGT